MAPNSNEGKEFKKKSLTLSLFPSRRNEEELEIEENEMVFKEQRRKEGTLMLVILMLVMGMLML